MTATEVGVLIEDLRSQFRIFGEKLDALESKYDSKFETLESKVGGLENKIDGIAANQARTLERVTSLEITARKIQSDVTEIKEALKDHAKRLTHPETIK